MLILKNEKLIIFKIKQIILKNLSFTFSSIFEIKASQIQ